MKPLTTKAEYDAYMLSEIVIDKHDGKGPFNAFNLGFSLEDGTAWQWYQRNSLEDPRVPLFIEGQRGDKTPSVRVWIKIDPRFIYTQNRVPYEYKNEYRGEAETWGPVPEGLL